MWNLHLIVIHYSNDDYIPHISVNIYKVWSNTIQSMPHITRFANLTNLRYTYVKMRSYPAQKCQYIYHKVLVAQKIYTRHASTLSRAHVPFCETYVFTVDLWDVCRTSALLMNMTVKSIYREKNFLSSDAHLVLNTWMVCYLGFCSLS